MTYINDLHNRRFGKLVAIKYLGDSRWMCVCDCGNTVSVRTSKLVSGNTKSCKCYRNTLLARERTLGKGYAAFREVLRSYIRTAAKRKLEFGLSEAECHLLMEGNCFYCGIAPNAIKKHRECFGDFIYNGIDRVDSNKGYTKDNTVTCCKHCNYAKNNMTILEFSNWLERIYTHKDSWLGEKK